MNYTLYPPQAIHELGQRSNQEDTIFPAAGRATEADRLFIVCDGMGGHEHGEVASATVAQALSEHIAQAHRADEPFSDDMLRDAIAYAYDQLNARDTGSSRKMGTTLTLLYMYRGGVTAAHIGDSRIYHLRPTTGEIRYISRDHSLVMDLYQAGEIGRDEMRTSPQKNVITRAMTPGTDGRAKPDIVHIADVRPGDYFYLCSDGMLEQMTDDELLHLIADNTTDDEKRDALICATIANKDNHSAYLVHVAAVTSEPGDEALTNDEATVRFNAINIYRQREQQDAADVTVLPPPSRTAQIDVSQQPSVNPPMSDEQPPRSRKGILALAAVLIALLALGGYYFWGKSEQKAQGPDTINCPEAEVPETYAPEEQVVTPQGTATPQERGSASATPAPSRSVGVGGSEKQHGTTGENGSVTSTPTKSSNEGYKDAFDESKGKGTNNPEKESKGGEPEQSKPITGEGTEEA